MRTVVIGVVTGTCFCVLALAAVGAIDGYSNPDGYPPGLLPGLPRCVAGCFWGLAYFGLPAGSAGAFLGGIVGGLGAGIRWALTRSARQSTAVQRGSAEQPR
jgi:hypothetical protein